MNPMLFFAVLVLAMLVGMGALIGYAMSGRHRRSEDQKAIEAGERKKTPNREET